MWEYTPIYPCGALNGTAEDLARFGIALTPPEGTVSQLFETMDGWLQVYTSSYPDASQMVGTYHGFQTFSGSGTEAFGHGGNNAGFSSSLVVMPEDRFGVVVLVNSLGEIDLVYGVMDLLIGNNTDTMAGALNNNMPHANEVEGTYVTARRYENTFALVANYIQLSKVTAIDENRIFFNIMGLEAIYLQTEPYVYHLISAENPIVRQGAPVIRFKMEDGRPVQIMVGNGTDFTSLPQNREIPNLIFSLIIIAASTLFFLVMLIVMLVRLRAIQKRSSSLARFPNLNIGLYITGILLALNNTIAFVRMGVINNYRSAAEMIPHIWINWVLLAVAAVLLVMSLVYLKKEEVTKKQKAVFTITVVLMALFIIVQFHWNFFMFL
jgi:heme/copper-type cytochrome/quinol oxidase subunit 3